MELQQRVGGGKSDAKLRLSIVQGFLRVLGRFGGGVDLLLEGTQIGERAFDQQHGLVERLSILQPALIIGDVSLRESGFRRGIVQRHREGEHGGIVVEFEVEQSIQRSAVVAAERKQGSIVRSRWYRRSGRAETIGEGRHRARSSTFGIAGNAGDPELRAEVELRQRLILRELDLDQRAANRLAQTRQSRAVFQHLPERIIVGLEGSEVDVGLLQRLDVRSEHRVGVVERHILSQRGAGNLKAGTGGGYVGARGGSCRQRLRQVDRGHHA